ncbi:MAG: hypothetical protein COT92_03145 [Candidatus Doudnabacteria bacterium CG10_big_fil_rev_8_21_14_0_10_42_18]|uniref:Uncharacterized protein n=1 Tax=Candidatus Doudnabacteria bacterium CG10_big_fil_rev_8_21_14_0_10_42_18 TaxID=1974552 RepID=A0A2H0VAB5_9BACT|nr:MAG: hypothetical protein COT92_03145 [Candidatus Doudnabacteria bacterium CG10_big_fil_rev_8_21_14_0_10_42_18]
MKKYLFVIFTAALLIAIAVFYKQPAKAPSPEINNFEDCAAAGFPVIESIPRECRNASGVLFTEIITE